MFILVEVCFLGREVGLVLMIRNFIVIAGIRIASSSIIIMMVVMCGRVAIAGRRKRRAAIRLAGKTLSTVRWRRRHMRNRRWRKTVATSRRRRSPIGRRRRRLWCSRTALAVFGKWIALTDQPGEFGQRVAT